jgi:type IV pilus assembly protein PilA
MELMIVIVIVGILATLAVYGVRRYVLAAKTSEPIEIINSIRAAQETFRDETFAYRNVSTTINTYHPGAPDGAKHDWNGAGVAPWNELGVRVSAPVQFSYACVASGPGLANNTVPSLGIAANLNYPAVPTSPWYVVKAVGDRDVDGDLAVLIGSSFTDVIHSEKDDE